jgi:cytochrome c
MHVSTFSRIAAGALVALAGAFLSTAASAQAVDEEAAKALFKRNDCAKCHHPTREKKGPSLAEIVKELKGKPDAEQKIIKNITTGPKVKLRDDKKEEEHKIVDTKDEKQLKNLAQWLLKQ